MPFFKSVSLFFLFFILVQGCSDEKTQDAQPQSKAEPPPLPVEIIVVKNEQVPIWIEYTSRTEATKRIEVRARVSGRLEKVLFTEGDLVNEGQKLFGIEKSGYEAEVAKAKAALAKDMAGLKLATANVKRYEPLVAEGLAPRITLEQYQAQEMEFQAAIEADKAAIREAELNLSYTDILSPITGRISRTNVDVGNIVGYSERTLLTTIVADNPMYAYFNPTEQDFQIMRKYRDQEQMDARVRVPDTRADIVKRGVFTGKVDFTDNKVDPMTGTITMRAIVDNPEHNLLEGTFVYTDVFVSKKGKFMMVPPSIVTDDQQGSFLYIVDQDDRAKRVYIQRGTQGRYYLHVQEGLNDGDRVIVSGLQKVRDSLRVAPKDVSNEKSVMAVLKSKNMSPGNE